MNAAESILPAVEGLGYAVSVFHMEQYVELHAVHLSGDHIFHIAH